MITTKRKSYKIYITFLRLGVKSVFGEVNNFIHVSVSCHIYKPEILFLRWGKVVENHQVIALLGTKSAKFMDVGIIRAAKNSVQTYDYLFSFLGTFRAGNFWRNIKDKFPFFIFKIYPFINVRTSFCMLISQ